MSEIAIRAEGIAKQFQLGERRGGYRTLRDTLAQWAGMPARAVRRLTGGAPPPKGERLWALKDVSFEVRRGEVVGIIGRNGAGKSTLLKILSRITEPTEGFAEIHGRVGSLLEVGTGFHPELTGRENTFLNGAILGMRKEEIARKFDEIVAFAEVEKFIDTPVKHYSSGMYVRLAFAVAAHLEPEILLIDEVLAVGDSAFQKKCLNKMDEVSRAGRTILFVSHNMSAVQNLCTRGLVLRGGGLALDAPIDEAVRDYLTHLNESAIDAFTDNPERSGAGWVRLTSARTLDEFGEPSRYLVAGRPAAFEFAYDNQSRANRANVVVTIFNHLGVAVTNFDMKLTGFEAKGLMESGRFVCRLPNLPLPPGQYRVAVAVQVDAQTSDLIPNALVFNVESSTFFRTGRTPRTSYCAVMVEHEWRHESAAAPADEEEVLGLRI